MCFDLFKHNTSGWTRFVKHITFNDTYNILHFHEILHHNKTVVRKLKIRQNLLT